MTGWLVARACRVACLFGELSQHSVTPQVWHVRKCTHRAWIFTHSSHSWAFAGLTLVTLLMCVHPLCALAGPL